MTHRSRRARRAMHPAPWFHAMALAAVPAFANGQGTPIEPPGRVATPAPMPAPAEPPASSPWRFTVMPYVWATGMSGSLRPVTGAPTVEFDKGFFETLEDLDGAFFLSFGAEKGRFVLLGDVSYVATSREGLIAGAIPAEGSLEQLTLSLGAGYRVHADSDFVLDLFAGVRVFDLQADLQAFGGALTASPSRTIVDPIIGARAILPFSERWAAVFYADVGGFGVGTESTVVASALVSYSFSATTALSLGYRAMWVDYDDEGTLADVTLGGPVIGLAFRF